MSCFADKDNFRGFIHTAYSHPHFLPTYPYQLPKQVGCEFKYMPDSCINDFGHMTLFVESNGEWMWSHSWWFHSLVASFGQQYWRYSLSTSNWLTWDSEGSYYFFFEDYYTPLLISVIKNFAWSMVVPKKPLKHEQWVSKGKGMWPHTFTFMTWQTN